MKNLFLTAALLLGLAVNANPITTDYAFDNSVIIETITNVNPFCTLIKQGNFEAVNEMIKAGADVNKKSVGMTPLMYAARYNKVEIVKLLIVNGADLKVRSDKGFTALKYAEISKAKDTYNLILKELKDQKANKKRKK